MTQEEKAKAYDEALERAKEMIKAMTNIGGVAKVDDIQHIFQLNESEDERIREDIIRHIEFGKSHNIIPCERAESWIAYLEKQGEKTSDKIVEKARTEKQRVLLTETDGSANIDWDCRSLNDVKILLKCGLEFIRTIEANKQITSTDNRFGGCSFRVPTRYDNGIKQGEQKPTIEMKSAEESLGIDSDTYNKIVDECIYGDDEQEPAWSEEDEYVFNKVLNWVLIVNPTSSIFEKLPKEQFIERFKSIRPQINVTDKELAQAKKDAYNDALDKIEYHSGEPTFDDGWSAAIWYLKKRNAQPQPQWKPSDEQMKALEHFVRSIGESGYASPYDNDTKLLYSLLFDLKKLREE